MIINSMLVKKGSVIPPVVETYKVRWFDYDGSILKTELVTVSGSNATPPANPDHTAIGLTFQEWNSDSLDIVCDRDIGATYVTTDDKLHILLTSTSTSSFTIILNITNPTTGTEFTINWGDGSAEQIITTTGVLNISHLYTLVLNRDLTVWRSAGTGNLILGVNDDDFSLIGNNTTNESFVVRIFTPSYSRGSSGSFNGFTNLYALVLHSQFTITGYNCLASTGLSFIVVPNCNTSLTGEAVISYNSKLVRIALNQNLVNISNYLFTSCSSLVEINIPKNLKLTYGYVFSLCTALSKINKLSDYPAVTAVSTNSFKSTLISSIKIPEGYTAIAGNAFESSGLTSIEIPASVTLLSGNAFLNSLYLQSVTILGHPAIGSSTFSGCRALRTVDLGTSSLGTGATSLFSSCFALEEITIPSGFTSIPQSCFQNCYGLTSIVILEGITTIGTNAFTYCKSLPRIDLPESLTSVSGSNTFGYCRALKTVVLKYTGGVVTLSNVDIFSTCHEELKFYVPDALVDAYKIATNWVTYADRIHPMSEL